MRPGGMWNGESRSVDRLGVWTDEGHVGGPHPGFRCACGDVIITIVECNTCHLDMPWHSCAPCVNLRAPHLAHLETQTKESNMRASQQARKPVRCQEVNWWDPSWVHR
ncbi:uncharacterized protein LOC111311172 [Durio zibethinus]|uniref:Uncharacterized protein LOC111311172 n=1 Tax=Durio zibethinus TaxID=66656 RepID=A0A6P6AN47_DURZI|nr:uncharacterized protein LOC111311172 [Durio zibethinus]